MSSEPSATPVSTGILTTFGAAVGLALGPSVIAVLTISAYIQPIEAEFGWSRVQVSFAFTLVAYMIVLVSPLQGWCVDRFGARRTVLTSIPLFGLSLIALYFTPANLFVFYLLWALVPLAALGLWPLGYLQAVSQWFDRKLGFALGCANGGIGVGSTLVPLFTAAMIPLFGWRGAVLGLGIMVLLISWPVVYWCLHEAPGSDRSTRAANSPMNNGLPFKVLRMERSFIVLNIVFFMLGLTATGLVSQQVPLLTESGWTPTEARALITTVFGFSLLLARITVGFIMDYVFAPRVMQTVAIGGALACVLYALYPDAALVSAILLGFLLGAEFDVLAFLIKRYYGSLAYGSAYGVIFALFYLGSGMGITGLAWLRQISGSYDTGMYVAAVILALTAVLLLLLPQYRYLASHQPSSR